MDKVLKIVTNSIFIILIAFLVIYFMLRILGIANIYKVQTGSMEEGIHVGDYILVYKKNNYNIGDVVTYKKEGYHVTHRIIKKNGKEVITKGDANNVEDEAIPTKSIVGKVICCGEWLNFIIDYKYAIASILLILYLLSCQLGKREQIKNKTN
ncbi:MAG: signal peptidase I [Bacilli bacterium]|nr:signal peptidase I [Bacilli bacterium]